MGANGERCCQALKLSQRCQSNITRGILATPALPPCAGTLNVVVQSSCTAPRRGCKPHLSIRPENNQAPIEVVVHRVFRLCFQGRCPPPALLVSPKFTAEVLKAFFWTLTACEVTLIWSVNHLRSPIAHRILVILVHPWANFPPDLHISLPFAIVWSITLLSLIVHLRFKSHYRRIRRPSASINQSVRRDVSGKQIQTARRILLGSSPAVAFGSTLCYVLPGSFPYECWVWRMRFGGTIFCFLEVSYVAFWLVMVVWRCVRSRRGGGGETVSEPMMSVELEGVASSSGAEVLVMESLDHDDTRADTLNSE